MIVSQGSPSGSLPEDARASIVEDVERAVSQLRAFDWLTRQPLRRLPVLVWFADEDGGLVGHPADLSPEEARTAFDAWVGHLALSPDPVRHRGGITRLRAQEQVDGVLVTLHAEYRPPLGRRPLPRHGQR
ncbi:hypothetical protein [Spirillospora albida]|uniref:hypothetical protein n=1 Tax=Spirillospora albida TaxID=58123 RepID=UPI0004C0B643|nr:hypothetical protein [Spirillospora albida]